jgi:hypothetical protein
MFCCFAGSGSVRLGTADERHYITFPAASNTPARKADCEIAASCGPRALAPGRLIFFLPAAKIERLAEREKENR